MISASDDGQVIYWDFMGESLLRLSFPAGISCLTLSDDEQQIAMGLRDGSLYLSDFLANSFHQVLPETGSSLIGVGLLPKKRLVAALNAEHGTTSSGINGLKLYDLENERPMPIPEQVPHYDAVRSLAVQSERRLLAWSTRNRQLFTWALTSASARVSNLRSMVRSIAIAHSGGMIAYSADWKIYTRPWEDMRQSSEIVGHKGIVTSVTFRADDRILLSGSWDETIRLWDVQNQQEVARLVPEIGPVSVTAFSKDGLRLAAGSSTGQIIVYDNDYC